jgi:hypothetical protein
MEKDAYIDIGVSEAYAQSLDLGLCEKGALLAHEVDTRVRNAGADL